MIGHSVKKMFVALILTACLGGGTALSGETAGPISIEQAKSIALQQTGGGEVVEVDRHYRGNGVHYYRIVVLGQDGPYQLEIDANNGNLIQFIRKHGYKGYRNPVYVAPAPSAGAGLTQEQAMALALKQTGGGTVVEIDVDVKKHGRIIYEFEIINNGAKYEVEIDASTGTILEFERNGKHYYVPVQPVSVPESSVISPPPATDVSAAAAPVPAQAKMSAEAAQTLAMEKVGGGAVTEYKLETSNGRFFHEVAVVKDNRRHRMEIDDDSGTIRELSVRDAN